MAAGQHHLDPALPPAELLVRLPAQARRLLEVVAELYGGSCADCAEDLRRRRAGQPYLYRVDLPGIDALAWLHRFATYESARGERLTAALVLTQERL